MIPATWPDEQNANQDGALSNNKWGPVFGDMPDMVPHYLQKIPSSTDNIWQSITGNIPGIWDRQRQDHQLGTDGDMAAQQVKMA